MTTAPKLSVIMSVLNGGHDLSRALDSLFRQSFSDFEVIVIDDGSTDQTREILAACRDKRLRWYSDGQNQGLARRLNEGLNISTGQYIARMDADDICLPDRLSQQVTFLDRRQDVIGCGTDVVAVYSPEEARRWNYPKTPGLVRAGLIFQNTLAHPTLMLRRKALDLLDPFYRCDQERAEDYDMVIRLTALANLTNLPSLGLRYRYTGDEASRSARRLGKLTSDRLRNHLLNELGVGDDPEGRLLHAKVAGGPTRWQGLELRKLVEWFEKIHTANLASGVLPQAEFREVLTTRYIQIARHSPAQLPRASRLLARSSFAYQRVSASSRLLMSAVRAMRPGR